MKLRKRRIGKDVGNVNVAAAVRVPLFETDPQSWLTADRMLSAFLFGTRDLPEGAIEPREIHGGNMAVRRAVLLRPSLRSNRGRTVSLKKRGIGQDGFSYPELDRNPILHGVGFYSAYQPPSSKP